MNIDQDVVLTYLTHSSITSNPNSETRVISLNTLTDRWREISTALDLGDTIIVEKTDESIETLWHIIKNPLYSSWIKSRRIRFVTSSDAEPEIQNLNSEHFLNATIGSNDSTIDMSFNDQRTYTFLFTNRKVRPHRRYLILELQRHGLLDRALWSCLNDRNTYGHPDYTKIYSNGNTMPVKSLDPGYDPSAADWIDGIIHPPQYQQTWFTLVSETGFEYPHSFRTEKIWKPILAAHPFIVCANAGFYRDLKNLGFRTFDHWIDESFDSVVDGQQRLDRLIHAVQWLCQQDLAKFWQETRDICLYNHQQALELHSSLKMDFSRRFLEFMHA